MALTVLILRDAYLNTKLHLTRQLAFADAVVTATFIYASQFVLSLTVPLLAVPTPALIRGMAIGLLVIATLRSIIRQSQPAAVDEPGAQQLWTWRMHAVWMAGCLAEGLTNGGSLRSETFVLMFVPLASTVLVAWLEKRGGIDNANDLKSLFQNKRPSISRRGSPREMYFVFLLALPSAMVVGAWLESGFSPANPGFLRAWANVIVLSGMTVFWIYAWRYSPEDE